MSTHISAKEENKYVKAEKAIPRLNIERRKRFLQVEGTRGKGTKLISHKGNTIDSGRIIDTKFNVNTGIFK